MASINDIDNMELGRSSDEISFDTLEDNHRAFLALLRQTQHTLCIMSRDLDPRLYGSSEVREAIKDIALGSRHAQVRIIVQEPSLVINRGHRIIDLARRLPSYIHIRVPAREHANYNGAFVIADRVGTVFRSLADRYDGNVCFNDPRHADQLGRLFDEMWESATTPADLRALRL